MDPYIGKLLDNRYEILDAIGVGGMAMVYKAYCHRLHRYVAVKILRKDLAADAEFRRRFHDEAQAVAMLSHANIVSVYDVSRGEDLEYIVMELIDGITLKQFMKKKGGILSWREALHYITQIMRALSHAHSRGIIHRDIKPQNIMVLRDGSVRVADFGIARVMSAAQNTLTQEALGSVHYISPEQARGSHLDERADIYSAGVVLYEMLTGRLPFEGDSPVSVAIQHISAIPLAPRELNDEIPEALESITLKAMSSNVERRYKNAEEMIRDLEEFRKNPEIDFGYEHHGYPQSDEPTQVLDTSSITGSLGKKKSPTRGANSFEDEEFETYRTTSTRRQSENTSRRATDLAARRTSERQLATKKRNAMVPIIVVVSIFILGVAAFLWMFMSDLFKAPEVIHIPTLVNKTLDEVRADTALNEQFEIEVGKQEASEKYDEGYIIAQSPDAGTEAKGEKTKIVVTVSSGKTELKMPDLTSQPYAEARKQLEGDVLELKVELTYEFHDEIAKDLVISTQPGGGEPVAKGDAVILTISKGKEPRKAATVPPVQRRTQADAERMLKEAGLLSKVEPSYSNEEVGTVFQQIPVAGTQVEPNSTVTIYVSKGLATKTKTIDIALPTDGETVNVKVTVSGETQFEKDLPIHPDTPIVSVSLTALGNQEVVIYLDGNETDRYPLDFNT